MVFGVVYIEIFMEHVIQAAVDLVEIVQVTFGGDLFSYIQEEFVGEEQEVHFLVYMPKVRVVSIWQFLCIYI